MRAICIICAAFFVACTGSPEPTPQPEWAASPDGVEQVYPNQNFIAQMGCGTDRTAAENDALAQIARYFSTQIETKQVLVHRSLGENNILTTKTKLIDEIYTRSQAELFTVRYTQSWYNAGEQQWQTVAYINRDEAWLVYEPRARREAERFLTMYRAAGQVEETIHQYGVYGAALALFERDVVPMVFFAEILHPAKAAVAFADVQEAVVQIPVLINKVRAQSYIYLQCDNDYEGRILAAAAQAWNELGFPVQKTRIGAVAVCTIIVTNNEMASDSGSGSRIFSYRPSVSLTLIGKTGTLFAWNSQPIDRVITATRDVGRRRAYTILAAELEQSFSAFFREKMGHDFR